MDKILSVEEAVANSLTILNENTHSNPKEKNVAVCCELIAPKFKNFVVKTSIAEITELVEEVKTYSSEEVRNCWLSVLRSLMKYSTDELIKLYNKQNDEWFDFCNDAVLWFCYNSVLFKKGIPVIEL